MKIVPVILRYNYGMPAHGDSLEHRGFYPALKTVGSEVHPFWYDAYLTKKDELQKRVIEFIEEINPDLVFFMIMKDEFSFDTFDRLKKRYRTVNWFCDDRWRFDTFTRYYAPHFTYSITADKPALAKYREMGYTDVILSHWASYGSFKDLNFDGISYVYDVSFVGKVSGYRRWIIERLRKRGIRVFCFGYGWDNGVVSYDEMSQIFKTSKINLNLSNSVCYDVRCIAHSLKNVREIFIGAKKSEEMKARNFEIPAFGGFQLTHYVSPLEDYFEIGKEVSVYDCAEDLENKIRYYLHNEDERREIMMAGYRRAIHEHTYTNRLQKVFDEIKHTEDRHGDGRT